jgi:hypothetical protein
MNLKIHRGFDKLCFFRKSIGQEKGRFKVKNRAISMRPVDLNNPPHQMVMFVNFLISISRVSMNAFNSTIFFEIRCIR